MGTFDNFSGLAPGKSYSRTEAVTLPVHISGLYNVEVITNSDGSLFENGATANNTGVASPSMTVTVMPRPDLQVAAIDIPSQINAGGSFAVTYTVINQGNAPTTNNWDDKVYLSLTPDVEDDSILIQDLPNQSALIPGEEYQATTVPVTVPQRYSGQVYVIVVVDAGNQVDQWPNGQHSTEYRPIYVNPIPLPDLVLSNVVVPAQVIAGSTFNVSYTVTNLGAGPTLVNTWTDSVWLTGDKTRPIPAEGDILLTQFTHTGSLDVKAGYDQTVSVTLPLDLQPGTYYVTPWTDLYSAVLQDTLAVNVNPDDPNNLYSDNYKAAQIAILAPLPDLIVTSVTAPAKAQGGDNFTVNWTVENDGNGVAGPTGWIDTVYLTNDPTNPLDPNAITMTLGSVEHDTMLNPDATYNASLTVELSPSAVGQYIVVYTDAPQPNLMTPVNLVTESDEDNNLGSTNTDVTPVPADLVVTNVSIPKTNYSGESMTFSYTVTNEGPDQVWAGTHYWTDFIWLSTDTTFVRTRASFLGQTTHEQDPAAPAGRELHRHLHGDPAPRHGRPVLPVHRPRRAQRPAARPLHLHGPAGDDRLVARRHGRQLVLAGRVRHVGVRGPGQQPDRDADDDHLQRAGPQGDEHHGAVGRGLGHDDPDHLHGDQPGDARHPDRRLDRRHLPLAGRLARHRRHRAGDRRLRPGPGGPGLVHRDGQRPRPRRHPGDLRHPGVRRLGRVHQLRVAEQHRLRPLRHRDRPDQRAGPLRPGLVGDPQPGPRPRAPVRERGRQAGRRPDARDPGPVPRLAGDRHQHRRRTRATSCRARRSTSRTPSPTPAPAARRRPSRPGTT